MGKMFKLGNQTVEYNWDTEEYTKIYSKFLRLARQENKVFKDTVESLPFGPEFADKVETACYRNIVNIYGSFADEYIEKGKYSFSVENFTKSNAFQHIMQPAADCFKKLFTELSKIEDYKQSEAQHRAIRKDSRARLVGGGFGFAGAAKGIIKAESFNMASGALHSVYNFFDKRSTDKKAEQATVIACRHFANDIVEAMASCRIYLLRHLQNELGIKTNLYSTEYMSILNNIDNGTINENNMIPALTKALRAYPYDQKVYNIFIEEYPEYSDDLKTIADHFKVNIEEAYRNAHESDGVFFNDLADKQFVDDNIVSKIIDIESEYTDFEDIVYDDRDYFLKTLDIEFIDELIGFFNTVEIPEGRPQLLEYINSKKDFYNSLRKEVKINIIPEYEAVDALADHYDGMIENNFYALNAIPEIIINTVMKYNDTLHKEDMCFAFDASYKDTIQAVVITPDRICVVNDEKNLYKEFPFDKYGKIEITEGQLKLIEWEDENNIVSVPLEKCADTPEKFGYIMSQILYPQKLQEPFKNALIEKHKVSIGEAPAKEDLAKARLLVMSEYKAIQESTNERLLSSDPEELKSWYKTLSNRSFVTEKANKIITRIGLLSKANTDDLKLYEELEPYLPKNIFIEAADINHFEDVQNALSAATKSDKREIALFRTIENSLFLTTQNIYYIGDCDKLSDILSFAHIKDQVVLIKDKTKLDLLRSWFSLHLSDTLLLELERFFNRTLMLYRVNNIATYKPVLLSERYYFFNKIFNKLVALSKNLSYEGIYDGSEIKLGDNDTKARNVCGDTSYIFKYIDVTVFGDNRGMGLTDSGLYLWLIDAKSPIIIPWSDLAQKTITTENKNTLIYINGKEYSMGASRANGNDWANYLNEMIKLYNHEMDNYPLYATEIEAISEGKGSADLVIGEIDGSHILDGVFYSNTKDKDFIVSHVLKGLDSIQKKYIHDGTLALDSKEYFLENLDLPFINEIITFLEGISVEPEKAQVLDYIENKKKFYIPLRDEMKELADKKYINDEILKIQARYPGTKKDDYSDKEYFLKSLNLPFIDDIITFLEGVSVDPDNNKLLEYIENRKSFYLQLRHEMGETSAEHKEIYDITNKDAFSTNLEELEAWNALLSTKEYHTEKAIDLVDRIRLLSSYSQKDLDFFALIASKLPNGKDIITVNANNFVSIQKRFLSKLKTNEIVLCYTEDGIGKKAWMLTTQHFYISNSVYDLADALHIINIDNYLLFLSQGKNVSLPYNDSLPGSYVVQRNFGKEQLAAIARSLNSVFRTYLEQNLPDTRDKILTHEYYFYNVILQELIKNNTYVLPKIHDGLNVPINDRVRDISANKNNIILGYVETKRDSGDIGMALTDQGLYINQEKAPERSHYKWDQLANAKITVKKSFFSKDEIIINGKSHSMGNTDAKADDWVYYLNKMIAVYKECITKYPTFKQKIQSLPIPQPLNKRPTSHNTVYTPPKDTPVEPEPASRISERQNTDDSRNSPNSGIFSSFTSSIMNSSKSAIDKVADIGTKSSSSLASSFMKNSKSAFGKIKDVSTKASESVLASVDSTKNDSRVKTTEEKICPNCGASIEKDKLFCGMCGTKYVEKQKKHCPSCGAEVEDGMKFCGMCGAKMDTDEAKFCPKCGTKLPASARFCGNCGSKV